MATEIRQPPVALPFYYGWVHGLITEPLLRDLQNRSRHFARINLWATLAMAVFTIALSIGFMLAFPLIGAIASALGPLILAETVSRTGSYATIFYLLTIVAMVLAVLAWLVKVPSTQKG